MRPYSLISDAVAERAYGAAGNFSTLVQVRFGYVEVRRVTLRVDEFGKVVEVRS